MSGGRVTVIGMSATPETTLLSELCPVCASDDVRAAEQGWFLLELDRRAELLDTDRDDEIVVIFACRDCGWQWG